MQVLNAHVPERSYWGVVRASAAVTQQLCTVVAAVAVPVHLKAGNISTQHLMVMCGLLLVLGEAGGAWVRIRKLVAALDPGPGLLVRWHVPGNAG